MATIFAKVPEGQYPRSTSGGKRIITLGGSGVRLSQDNRLAASFEMGGSKIIERNAGRLVHDR